METIGPHAALIIIDVQEGFDEPRWGKRNNPEAEDNIARLLDAWRRTGQPLFHVKHDSPNARSPLHPDSPGNQIKDIVRPLETEALIRKSVHSAFVGTDLEERLRHVGAHTVVLTGLTTNHCVETTARMASDLGFTTYFVWDATATFDRTGPDGRRHSADDILEMTLSNLHDEFACIVTTDVVLEQVGMSVADGTIH